MKKFNRFGIVLKDGNILRYMDGVSATERKQYRHQRLWDVFRLMIRHT